MNTQLAEQAKKFRRPEDLVEELFGYRPHRNTPRNWRRGILLRNGKTKALRTVKVGREYLTTAEWLTEFLTSEPDIVPTSSEQTSKQAKQKAKADAVANIVCEAFNI